MNYKTNGDLMLQAIVIRFWIGVVFKFVVGISIVGACIHYCVS